MTTLRGLFTVSASVGVVWLAAMVEHEVLALGAALLGVTAVVAVSSLRRLHPAAVAASVAALLPVGAAARFALPVPAETRVLPGVTVDAARAIRWTTHGSRNAPAVHHQVAPLKGAPGWVLDPPLDSSARGLLRLPYAKRSGLPAPADAGPCWEVCDDPTRLQAERMERAIGATAAPLALYLVLEAVGWVRRRRGAH